MATSGVSARAIHPVLVQACRWCCLTSPEQRGKKNNDCHDFKTPQEHTDAEQPFGRMRQDGEILVRSDDIAETRTDIADRRGRTADAGEEVNTKQRKSGGNEGNRDAIIE